MKAIGCAATLILVIVLLGRGDHVEAKKGPKRDRERDSLSDWDVWR